MMDTSKYEIFSFPKMETVRWYAGDNKEREEIDKFSMEREKRSPQVLEARKIFQIQLMMCFGKARNLNESLEFTSLFQFLPDFTERENKIFQLSRKGILCFFDNLGGQQTLFHFDKVFNNYPIEYRREEFRFFSRESFSLEKIDFLLISFSYKGIKRTYHGQSKSYRMFLIETKRLTNLGNLLNSHYSSPSTILANSRNWSGEFLKNDSIFSFMLAEQSSDGVLELTMASVLRGLLPLEPI
jgi:hypothetical protein